LLPVWLMATLNAMDESHLLGEISRVLEGDGERKQKAAGIAGRSGASVVTGGCTSTK
jgi:hypothetical protein